MIPALRRVRGRRDGNQRRAGQRWPHNAGRTDRWRCRLWVAKTA